MTRKTIARIPSMDSKKRASTRKNAENKLKEAPDNKDARHILAALDAFEDPPRMVSTGLLKWELQPREQKKYKFHAFHDDHEVGYIFKDKNHTSMDKHVYQVIIKGEELPEQFHHIKDARVAGEEAFAAQNAGNNS